MQSRYNSLHNSHTSVVKEKATLQTKIQATQETNKKLVKMNSEVFDDIDDLLKQLEATQHVYGIAARMPHTKLTSLEHANKELLQQTETDKSTVAGLVGQNAQLAKDGTALSGAKDTLARQNESLRRDNLMMGIDKMCLDQRLFEANNTSSALQGLNKQLRNRVNGVKADQVSLRRDVADRDCRITALKTECSETMQKLEQRTKERDDEIAAHCVTQRLLQAEQSYLETLRVESEERARAKDRLETEICQLQESLTRSQTATFIAFANGMEQ